MKIKPRTSPMLTHYFEKPTFHSLTIIIPSYNRYQYLTTCLAYWENYPVQIIVVDGSEQPYNLNSKPEEKITYFHLPVSIEERLRFAAKEIKTDYCVICPDDEFLSFNTLAKAIEILAAQPKVSAVCGETVAFATLGDSYLMKKQYQNGLLDISGITALERFRQRRLVDDSVIFYSLMRKDLMILATNFIAEEIYTCPYVGEVQMEAILCAAGEVVILPNVMWYRNRDAASISHKDFDRSIDLVSWLNKSQNIEEIENLSDVSSRYFLEASRGDNSLSGKKFLESYTSRGEHRLKGARKLINACSEVILMVYSGLPTNVKQIIRKILIFSFGRTPSGLLSQRDFLQVLEKQGISYDIEEVERIRYLVVSYEQNKLSMLRSL